MKTKSNSATSNKYTTADGYSYLTKRTLVSKAKAAGKLASSNAMRVMGFIVVAEKGWVVKKFENGLTERISRIAK